MDILCRLLTQPPIIAACIDEPDWRALADWASIHQNSERFPLLYSLLHRKRPVRQSSAQLQMLERELRGVTGDGLPWGARSAWTAIGLLLDEARTHRTGVEVVDETG